MKRKKDERVFRGLAKNREGLTFAEWFWAATRGNRMLESASAGAYEAWQNGTHPHSWRDRRGLA